MNSTQQVQRSQLTAVPAPTPEIESEINRLSNAIERAASLAGELSSRLHTVRAEEDSASSTAPKEVEPNTKLGGQIRAMSDRIDQIGDQLAYQLRTVALPN